MSNANILKTCAICGQSKPLSAFLQMGESGALYGNVCATCRSEGKTLKEPKDTGESTTSTSRKELDSKAKFKLEEEILQNKQDIEERDEEERKDKDERVLKQTQKSENIAKQDKVRQKGFLDNINFSKTPTRQETVNTPVDVAQQDESMNLQHSVQDTQVAGKLKKQSPFYNALKTWLGADAPILGAAEKAARHNIKNAQQQKIARQNLISQKRQTEQAQEKLVEMARKNKPKR